jgi:DNA-binding SARP family transcriptional activator
MAPELQVRCLGRLSLRCCEAPEGAASDLPLPPTLKAQSLLAYLVAHRDRPRGRDHLAELFWGDRLEHNARRSLATALWQIRRCLPSDNFILADTAHVQLNPHRAFWLDVAEFEKLARTRTPPAHVSALQQADFLYLDDLLRFLRQMGVTFGQLTDSGGHETSASS